MQQVGNIVKSLVDIVIQVITFAWNWSFGQIVRMFELNFMALSLWKQILFVVVIAALVFLIWKIGRGLLDAFLEVMGAIVGLFSTIVDQLKYVIVAGVIAFGGAWVLLNFNF